MTIRKVIVFTRVHLLMISALWAGSEIAVPPGTITRIAEIRSLSREAAAQGVPVMVRGVLTWMARPSSFVLQDESAGIYVLSKSLPGKKRSESDETTLASVSEGA